MREIKFRAWDNVKDRMYSVGEEDDVVFSIESNGIVAIDITEDVDEFKTLHHLEYMQFTGLVDKNGVEIYEGDICKYELTRVFFSDVDIEETDCIGVVIFKGGAFYHNRELVSALIKNIDSFEVIGNIYENKDLLATV